MLKVGLVGFGFMGRMHYENYVRLMEEGFPLQLTAICDIAIDEIKDKQIQGNIATGQSVYDLSGCRLYTNVDDMLREEELDYIDIALPTYLHPEVAIKALNSGSHVLCEKPMALNVAAARDMEQTAAAAGKTLMIAQCLRFWPAYEYLQACVSDGRYGAATGGYFFRGGGTPNGWYREAAKSGGCLVDMHIHDVDMIQYLFGLPEQVSTIGRHIVPGGGYDIVSANYKYADGKIINAQCDWTLQGDFGFAMTYRVNFERANLVFENGVVTVNPNDQPAFCPELDADMGYYREIRYFAESILNSTPVTISAPESTLATMALIEAEIQSADDGGEWVKL